MELNINPILEKVRATVENHKLFPGAYARDRWIEGGIVKLGPLNEYGCADAANIRYTLGDMPLEEEERRACVQILQNFQNPETGMFKEPTHVVMHGTAHCSAALELFDARPLYPMKDLEQYQTVEGMISLLESLPWYESPNGHTGAGMFSATIIMRKATYEWKKAYFDWLDAHVDPEMGFGMAGFLQVENSAPVWRHLNDWFHYLFNYHFARRPFPYAAQLVDSCIRLYREGGLRETFGKMKDFSEIDWVFALNRASWQTGHRYAERTEVLMEFAEKYIGYLESVDTDADPSWNDLHLLFGMVCALSELQLALPGVIRSEYPLRQVLDRRPFI